MRERDGEFLQVFGVEGEQEEEEGKDGGDDRGKQQSRGIVERRRVVQKFDEDAEERPWR